VGYTLSMRDANEYIGESIQQSDRVGSTEFAMCIFLVTAAVRESNRFFTWIVVTARWSGFGPRPVWADDDKRFILDRRRIGQ